MPTDWQTHLQNYKESHPDLSLKQCMQKASKTYRGTSSSKPKPSPKTKKNDTKQVLTDVIGLSKAISHVTAKLDSKQIRQLKRVADALQEIHDANFSDESDSDSSGSKSE